MRFVETVLGEFRTRLEDRLGGAALNTLRDGARNEIAALRGHLLLVFLAHRTAQDIRLPEAVAGEIPRDLLHLLLVGDDAVGRLEDGLQLGMGILDRLMTALARTVGWDVRHRPGPIKRHERDDVLEAVGAHVGERPPHPLPFHLEDANGLAAREHLVALGVVERDARELEIDAAPVDELRGEIEHAERLEAEEVELDEPGWLNPLHVELGHRHVGLRIAIERHQFDERPIADYDAGRMRGRVPVQSLQLHRDIEGALDHRFGIARGLQARLLGNRLRQGHGRRRIHRHEFGKLVDLPVRHFEHAADVAQHAPRLQCAKGDDLRDLIAPVALLNVADYFVAPVLTEIDVEVRHRHALGIQKALEQKPEADRIKVGDGERVGDKRARARAAARSDGNALKLRPLDKVSHDQEVAGILHLLDHRQLEIEPLAVIVDRAARGETERLDAARESLIGLAAQLRIFIDGAAVQRGEARQDRLARLRTERAALRDLNRGGECLGQIRE